MTHPSLMGRFARNRLSLAALVVLLLMVLAALVGPYLTPYDPYEQDIDNRLQGISPAHPLGTDYVGRDLLTRVVHGARVSIGLSALSVCLGGTAGVVLGLLAGYYGGAADGVISRLIELLMALPGLLLAVLIVSIMGPGNTSTVAAVSIMVIPAFARMTRGMALSLRESDFVQACRLMGQSGLRIILAHILPNCLPMILITFTLNLGTAAVTTSSLSFVGLGVSAPYPEWGRMIFEAKATMRLHPLGLLAPCLAVTLFVMSASLVGDGLRDALDPRLVNT